MSYSDTFLDRASYQEPEDNPCKTCQNYTIAPPWNCRIKNRLRGFYHGYIKKQCDYIPNEEADNDD